MRLLQRAAGCGVDGAFGPVTHKAAADCDLAAATSAYCDAREAYYRLLARTTPRLQVFLKGWLNRLNALRTEVGVSDLKAVVPVDLGDAPYIARIPDFGENPAYDVEPSS